MEHRPEQHRGMAVREHEPIAVGPDRVLRIEAHGPVPDRIHQWRERHGCTRVSGLGLLHRIYREGANSIDSQLNSFIICHGTSPWDEGSGFRFRVSGRSWRRLSAAALKPET